MATDDFFRARLDQMNVVWQFFSGMAYYTPKLPCDAKQVERFRRVLGEAGVEQLLKTTIEAAGPGSERRCIQWRSRSHLEAANFIRLRPDSLHLTHSTRMSS